MDLYALGFRHLLGHARLSGGFTFVPTSMAWESYFECLEFDPRLFDVDCLVGLEPLLF